MDDACFNDIMRHARACAALSPPEEAAGVVKDGRYIPLKNIAADPQRHFTIAASALKNLHPVEAVVHSHPGGPAWPSFDDMRAQIDSGVPWIIAVVPTASHAELREEIFRFGDVPVLKPDAGYRHGVDDCYSLIRGFYQTVLNITLPEFPREWEWWHSGGDLYQDGLGEAGFSQVDDDAPRAVGDVFLARVRSDVVNHAGVWIGSGLIWHHLGGAEGAQPERLPRKEPVERWMKFIDTWIRHRDVTIPS